MSSSVLALIFAVPTLGGGAAVVGYYHREVYKWLRKQYVYRFVQHDPKKIKCPNCGHLGCKVTFEPRYQPLTVQAQCDRCGANHGRPPIVSYEAWKS